MKTKPAIRRLFALAGAAALATLLTPAAHAQTLYTTDFNGSGNINSYNAAGTATPGFTPPTGSGSNGIAVSGNTVYVANYNANAISTYNATTGLAIGTFATLSQVQGLTISGTNLYAASANSVVDYNTATGATTFTISGSAAATAVSGTLLFVSNAGTVGEYSALTGIPINTSFITGQSGAWGLAVSGNDLFVANRSGNRISEYNVTTGALITSSFVSGLQVVGLADAGGILYAVGETTNRVYEYNDSTGALITSFALPSGDSDAQSIAVVPEPATWLAGALLLGGAGLTLRRRLRRA